MTAAPVDYAEALEARIKREVADGALLRHAGWERSLPGLACGITTAAAGDFGVSTATGASLLDGYGGLAEGLGFGAVAVPLQVHGTEVRAVAGLEASRAVGGGPPAVLLAGRVDGLVCAGSGLLLACTAADCVPVYLADSAAGVVGLVHAGWRGVAGGIAAGSLRAAEALGAERRRLRIHLGPAICGRCYEVDRPVRERLGRVDLRGRLVGEFLAEGVPGEAVTASSYCTRCGTASLHSHRGTEGKAGRMAAFIGRRSPG